jgi:hypothetical protein
MTKVILILVAVALFALLGPFLAIWSVNTLFAVGIEYGIKTWFAAFTLIALSFVSKVK